MSFNTASFINRIPTTTTNKPEMSLKRGPVVISSEETENQQNCLTNNEVSGIIANTTIDFLQIHLNSAISVIVLIIILLYVGPGDS